MLLLPQKDKYNIMEDFMKREELIEAAIWRRAIKTFDTKRKISKADFEALLKVAQYSPSSFGLEPWNIMVLQNKRLRELIMPYASGAQKQLSTASHFVIFTVKKDLYPTSDYFKHINMDIKGMSQETYNDFIVSFGSFSEIKQHMISQREKLDWAGKQSYIALANMMSAAALMGIDSCPIEGFNASEIENILGEYSDFECNKIVVMGAFGYRDEEPKHKKTRRDIKEIVNFVE